MNNVIHRHQSNGANFSNRKVIGMEKASYGQSKEILEEKSASPATEVVKEEVKTANENVSIATTELNREETRSQFSVLEKARKLEADAKSKLAKAEAMSSAYASKDLERIAKAHDMSVSDYVRWVNAKAVGAPTEKTLTPAEQVAANAKAWQEKMDNDVGQIKAKLKNAEDTNDKYSYINKNILPHIIKTPDTYEFINDKGADQVCSDVYDFMNQHYLETGGKNGGEELDPVELLNALEEKYMAEWKERVEKASKFKKLNAKIEENKTQTNVEGQPTGGTSPKTIGAKTVASPTGKSEAEIFAGINGGGLDEDALAQSAPSNLVGGASHGSAPSVQTRSAGQPSFQTGGTTPKNSKYSREARLAAMRKNNGE